nr:hypothetical protein GCM10020185_71090 [Pseudomonas brassicacearum subsp. brassicacearum]
MFELAQLRCFTTVATELNFRRAAERLNMTQPPLSRQIQLLEHHLGVELFTRSTRSVALTAAGRAFFSSKRRTCWNRPNKLPSLPGAMPRATSVR